MLMPQGPHSPETKVTKHKSHIPESHFRAIKPDTPPGPDHYLLQVGNDTYAQRVAIEAQREAALHIDRVPVLSKEEWQLQWAARQAPPQQDAA